MKRTFLIAAIVAVVAAFGAPTAAAQKSPCSAKLSRLTPAVPHLDTQGAQLWIQRSCGRRSTFPFG